MTLIVTKLSNTIVAVALDNETLLKLNEYCVKKNISDREMVLREVILVGVDTLYKTCNPLSREEVEDNGA